MTTEQFVCVWPQTLYAVALVYFSPDGSKHAVFSHIVRVSGENPLTREEAIARGRAATDAAVAKLGAEWDGWSYRSGNTSYAVQK